MNIASFSFWSFWLLGNFVPLSIGRLPSYDEAEQLLIDSIETEFNANTSDSKVDPSKLKQMHSASQSIEWLAM